MAELRGKGWRVLGYFLWMLGAGVALDSAATNFAAAVCLTGLLLFLIGAWQGYAGAEQRRRQG